MLSSNNLQAKPDLQSCFHLQSTHSFIDNEYGKEVNNRKKLHHLLSENYKLKQEISQLKNECRRKEQEQRQLKQHLKIVLQEMTNNDKMIQSYRGKQFEYQALNKHLQEAVNEMKHQLQTQKQLVNSLVEHNKNLQAQNELLIDIKEKYLLDLTTLKVEFDQLKAEDQNLIKEYQLISISNNKLLEEIEHLEEEIQTRRNNIEEYEKFVLQKLSNAKNNEEFHQHCKHQLQQINQKYIKYKRKSSMYKRERDQLRFHLQHLSKEIDGNTFRKYYDQL